MSNTIDDKVVQMRFDNKDFESNVQTSLGTIGRLKQALNFKDSSKSLENISSAAKNVDMSTLSNSVGTVQAKFSALQVMAITALSNITNSAVNAGKRIASALTIDPIKTGFQEYETQINAVQTILANTQSKGSTLKDVNAALDQLNTYADKTIYNFTEMTRNIGTFTAAGVDLKTSVDSIKGIANLAAISGSTSQQASTAMYQLSQALANGKVALQDWNSVVNAGMGGEVFQNALKRTAEHQGKNVDALIKKYGSFRESLTQGEWLTTEVLTETLKQLSGAYTEADLIAQGYTKKQAKEIMDLAKTGEDAATKVKTFTQLWDTLKEAAQSGWTQSWEIIIGDFEEAKELLTSVSDTLGEFIGKSAEARNKVLSDWKELGGRKAIIESIKNTFEGLISIIKPVKDAFKDVFPAITGKQLADISKSIQDLTSKFKISEGTADKIKRTFKGLFSILDIGKNAFMSFGKVLVKSGGFISNVADGILSVTAVIGDYISIIADAIERTDLFGTIFEGLESIIAPIGNAIEKVFGKIKDGFDSFGKMNDSPITNFVNGVNESLSPLEKLGKSIETIIGKISKVASSIGTLIGKAINGVSKMLSTALNGPESDRILGFLSGGLLITLIQKAKDLMDYFKGFFKSGGGMLSGITDTLDTIRGCLEAYQNQLKANTLIKIASAIAILAGSLVMISMIDTDKLAGSLTSIAVMMGELMGSIAIFDSLAGAGKFKSLIKVSTSMILMSTAILILSGAMVKLSSLDWNSIGKGLATVAGLCASLVTSSVVLSKASGKATTSAIGMIALATAIVILAEAVEKIGNLQFKTIGKGLLGIAGGLAIITSILNFTPKGMFGTSVAITIMASSLLILANAIGKMGDLSFKTICKGILTMVGALTALTVALNFIPKGMVGISVGITIIASSMLIFAEAINKMGSLSFKTIGKGMLTIVGALSALTVALNLIPKNILATSIAITIIASSLLILSNALKNMGQMSYEEIGKGLLTMAGSLTILAVAVNFMNAALPGAAAILIISASLAVLAPVLKILGSMTWGEIAKGLVTLAGALAIIGVAGLVLAPIVGPIALLGGAIALLGAGCLAAGAGVMAFSIALSTLATVGQAGVETILSLITGILNTVPLFLQKIAEGLVAFGQVIINSAPVIGTAISTLISTIMNVIVTNVPLIVETIMTLLTTLLQSIATKMPEFMQSGITIINEFIKGILQCISTNIPLIVETFIGLIVTILETIASKTDDFVSAGLGIIENFLKGLADGMSGIVSTAIQIPIKFMAAIATKIPEVVDSGFKLIISFINGLTNAIATNTPVLASAIKRLLDTGIKAGIQVIQACLPNFLTGGINMISNVIKGIKSKISNVGSSFKSAVSNGLSVVKSGVSSFVSAGGDLIGGLVSGIKSKVGSAISAIKSAASSVIGAAKRMFDINSPSKVFAEMGMYNMKGLAVGINKYSKLAVNATRNVGDKTIKSMNKTLSKLVFQNVDTQPTIRPVFDMSSIEEGVNTIDGLFANSRTVTLGTNVSGVNSIASSMNNKSYTTNDDVVSAIKELKNSLANVSGDTYSINGITYDDGNNVAEAVKAIVRAAKIERRK